MLFDTWRATLPFGSHSEPPCSLETTTIAVEYPMYVLPVSVTLSV